MDLGISGRTAAVAAASSGLGYGCAAALIAENVRVAICGRDEAKLKAAAEKIGATPIVCDLSSADRGSAFVAQAAEALGDPVDILVLNNGGPPSGGFSSTSRSNYQAAFEATLMSAVGMCEAAVPSMQKRKWGRIVGITSHVARVPNPGLILSGTMRTGLTSFLKALATDIAASGITVNTVEPGIHKTERLSGLNLRIEDLIAQVPAKIVGDPFEFGRIVAFLCSEHARFVTGARLMVDGGMSTGL